MQSDQDSPLLRLLRSTRSTHFHLAQRGIVSSGGDGRLHNRFDCQRDRVTLFRTSRADTISTVGKVYVVRSIVTSLLSNTIVCVLTALLGESSNIIVAPTLPQQHRLTQQCMSPCLSVASQGSRSGVSVRLARESGLRCLDMHDRFCLGLQRFHRRGIRRSGTGCETSLYFCSCLWKMTSS